MMTKTMMVPKQPPPSFQAANPAMPPLKSLFMSDGSFRGVRCCGSASPLLDDEALFEADERG